MLRVQPIEQRHVSATADLVARAMDVDAAYRYLFTDGTQRYAGLVRLFDRNLRIHLQRRCTYVALDESNEVVGTVTLRSPSFVPISKLTMIRRGLLPFAFRHGHEATQRLFWLKNTYDALEEELAEHGPHWYVHMMAVQPEQQGRGVGSELLARALSLAAEDDRNEKIVLTTHIPRNVVFYQRARFETAWERTIDPPHGTPYSVWGMTRRTAATGT